MHTPHTYTDPKATRLRRLSLWTITIINGSLAGAMYAYTITTRNGYALAAAITGSILVSIALYIIHKFN